MQAVSDVLAENSKHIDVPATDSKLEESSCQSSVSFTRQGNPLLELREWLSPENVALFVVCMADMLSTLYFVHSGMATEDNPIFRNLLRHGDGEFIGMKFLSFMPLIAVSTYYRRRRPRLIAMAMRFTVGVYVLLYVARFLAQFVGV